MAIHTRSDGRTVAVEIESPPWETPREIRVAVRHPERRAPVKVLVNDRPCGFAGEVVTIPGPQGRLRLECSYE